MAPHAPGSFLLRNWEVGSKKDTRYSNTLDSMCVMELLLTTEATEEEEGRPFGIGVR